MLPIVCRDLRVQYADSAHIFRQRRHEEARGEEAKSSSSRKSRVSRGPGAARTYPFADVRKWGPYGPKPGVRGHARQYGQEGRLDIGTFPPFSTAATKFACSTSGSVIFSMDIWCQNLCNNRRREFNNPRVHLPSGALLKNAGTVPTLTPASAEHADNGGKQNLTNPGFPPNYAMLRVANCPTVAPFSAAGVLPSANSVFLIPFFRPSGRGTCCPFFSGLRAPVRRFRLNAREKAT